MYDFEINAVLSLIAAMELETVWLVIGFFVLIALSAAAGIFVLLRTHNFAVPDNFMHSAMIVMLVITMILSLIFAVSLYRISGELREEPQPTSPGPEVHHKAPAERIALPLT